MLAMISMIATIAMLAMIAMIAVSAMRATIAMLAMIAILAMIAMIAMIAMLAMFAMIAMLAMLALVLPNFMRLTAPGTAKFHAPTSLSVERVGTLPKLAREMLARHGAANTGMKRCWHSIAQKNPGTARHGKTPARHGTGKPWLGKGSNV